MNIPLFAYSTETGTEDKSIATGASVLAREESEWVNKSINPLNNFFSRPTFNRQVLRAAEQ